MAGVLMALLKNNILTETLWSCWSSRPKHLETQPDKVQLRRKIRSDKTLWDWFKTLVGLQIYLNV